MGSNNSSAKIRHFDLLLMTNKLPRYPLTMPWKKTLALVTGQVEESLRQKMDCVLEENRVCRALLDRHSPS